MTVDERVPKYLWVDSSRLLQIFINLLQNALKFTYEGTINLSLDYDPLSKFLIGKVNDTGIGISDEDKSGLFKIFGQVKQNNVFTSGIGLGLHICKSLTEKFNGQIKIENSELGRGTTIVFTFQTNGVSSNQESRS